MNRNERNSTNAPVPPPAGPWETLAPASTIVARIRSEFLEMPGLHLTIAQASKLWALSKSECERILDDLTAAGFLSRTASGSYLRMSA